MPREAYLVARRAATLDDLAGAARRVDGRLRVVDAGAYQQVLDPTGQAVCTLDVARLVEDPELLAGYVDTVPAGPAWFVEASVPWSSDADAGVAVLRRLGEALGATLVLRDGR